MYVAFLSKLYIINYSEGNSQKYLENCFINHGLISPSVLPVQPQAANRAAMPADKSERRIVNDIMNVRWSLTQCPQQCISRPTRVEQSMRCRQGPRFCLRDCDVAQGHGLVGLLLTWRGYSLAPALAAVTRIAKPYQNPPILGRVCVMF